MEYLGVGELLVNFPNVYEGITTLATNLNFNSYLDTLKIEHYKHYKHFTPFQKKLTSLKITIK